MKDETLPWVSYADENLDVAGLALEHKDALNIAERVKSSVSVILNSKA